MRWLMVLLATPLLLLAACHGETDGPGHGAHKTSQQTFTNADYGIAIAYPDDFKARKGFGGSYLQNGNWKTYAGPHSVGQPIVSLVLAGSNDVTDAELRIGASRNTQAVKRCTQPPDSAVPDSETEATLDGVTFKTFKARDAAMSHYLEVKSYRAVHQDTCYALDLLVYGTNPKVYDPPRKPPFTHKHAFSRLQAALQGFRFTK
jgi:hypothetical protein